MICKLADAKEREQAFSQVHAVWPHDPDPAVHLQKRLRSIQHQRATWFVMTEEGAVVSSLGAYPFLLFGPGEDRPARAFGAVFTPAAERGKGHAARLLQWVMDFYAADGTLDFILYSDIDPAYYQKLGFRTLPSYEWGWDLAGTEPKEPPIEPTQPIVEPPKPGVKPIGEPPKPGSKPVDEPVVVSAHPMDPGTLGFRFGIRRQTEDARWAQEKQQQTLRLTRCRTSGNWLLSRRDRDTYTLLETNLSQRSEDWPELVRLVESDAREAGCKRVKGWWLSPEKAPTAALQDWVKPRHEEILMWMSRREADPWTQAITEEGFLALLSVHV